MHILNLKNAKKSSWDQYFGSKDKCDYIQNGTVLFDNSGINNYYVLLCFYKECKETGAICIQRTNKVCTLLEETVFTNCSSTTEYGGGSVYYNCQADGEFVQHRTCYYASIAEQAMAFAQAAKQYLSNKNYAIEVSVLKCGENEEKGSYTFGISFGDICFDNNNITNNKCIHQ